MPDELYDTDILAWSRVQAARLRRVAAGERVNDLDWAHVIEEVEDLGKSELKSVRSLLELALLHALKVAAWPNHSGAPHWEAEITSFLLQARARFEPGMRRRIDPRALYTTALLAVRGMRMPGATPALTLPNELPLTVTELRDPAFGAALLLERIQAPPPPNPDRTAPAHPPRGSPKAPRSTG